MNHWFPSLAAASWKAPIAEGLIERAFRAQPKLALGYFDQAHFIADFRKLVGRTPADYATAAKGNRSTASRAMKAG